MLAEAVLNRSIAAFASMADLARALAMALKRRKLVGELALLDEHLLRDMGITRQDVESALADPGLDDPTLRLAARAREARRGRRDSALEKRRWAAMLSEAEQPATTKPECRAA